MLLYFLATLAGCMQYHLPEERLDESPTRKTVIVEVSFRNGTPSLTPNGLEDFGGHVYRIISDPDVTTTIGHFSVLVERRDHRDILQKNDHFVPSDARHFFKACATYEQVSVTPSHVCASVGPYSLNFRGSVDNLPDGSVLDLSILCAMTDNPVDRMADLALTVPLEASLEIHAFRDDGTEVPQEEIEYRVIEERDNAPPEWFVHYAR